MVIKMSMGCSKLTDLDRKNRGTKEVVGRNAYGRKKEVCS